MWYILIMLSDILIMFFFSKVWKLYIDNGFFQRCENYYKLVVKLAVLLMQVGLLYLFKEIGGGAGVYFVKNNVILISLVGLI